MNPYDTEITKDMPSRLVHATLVEHEDPLSDSTIITGDPNKQTSNKQAISFSGQAPVSSSHITILPKVSKEHGTLQISSSPRQRFETVTTLGEGASGEVSLALDHDIGRKVALKHFKQAHINNEQMIRFVKEVQITGRLDHPNIASLHDVGLDADGRYYIIMKYHNGETLQDIIQHLKEGNKEYHVRFPFSERVILFQKILQAIQFAHQQGIIHRDLKPANIIVGRYGEVTVMDWGIAKVLQKDNTFASTESDILLQELPLAFQNSDVFVTQDHSLLGTIAYMSPEQAQGKNSQLDERTDVYSLCAILYELMTLRHYMEHQLISPAALWLSVISQPPMSPYNLSDPSGVQGSPPAEYLHFAMHGLHKDPNQRYPDVDTMLQRIHELLDGKIPIQCPITFVRSITNRALKIFNRIPFVMFGGMFLTLVFVGLGMVQAVRWIVHLFS